MKESEFSATKEALHEILEAVEHEISKYVGERRLKNRLKVSAEEILTNIISYAYPDTGGKIYVSCEFLNEKQELRFEFVDEGIPYNPLEEQPEVDLEADLDSRSIGGLGIFIYMTVMDHLEYKYENGQNHLIACKKLKEAELVG